MSLLLSADHRDLTTSKKKGLGRIRKVKNFLSFFSKKSTCFEQKYETKNMKSKG